MNPQAEIDPNVLETVVRIIADHPLAKSLEYSYLEDIGREAFHEDKLQDHEWLVQKLEETQIRYDADKISKNFETDVLAHIPVAAPSEIKSREDLDPILEKHHAWISAVLNPKVTHYYSGRANLKGAMLQGFDLSGINLSCADLREANLENADLSHANLSRCKLSGANLKGTRLFKTNLKGAEMQGAFLGDLDLSEAIT